MTFRKFFKIALAVIAAIVFLFLVAYFFVGRTTVSGISMNPTLKDGDVLYYSKQTRRYSRGDIVIARNRDNGQVIVKRVIGIPGDVLTFRDGEVLINGKRECEVYGLEWEGYDEGKVIDDMADGYEYTVPEFCYYLMGDNRRHSLDSRHSSFGAFNEDYIFGVVFSVVPAHDDVAEAAGE